MDEPKRWTIKEPGHVRLRATDGDTLCPMSGTWWVEAQSHDAEIARLTERAEKAEAERDEAAETLALEREERAAEAIIVKERWEQAQADRDEAIAEKRRVLKSWGNCKGHDESIRRLQAERDLLASQLAAMREALNPCVAQGIDYQEEAHDFENAACECGQCVSWCETVDAANFALDETEAFAKARDEAMVAEHKGRADALATALRDSEHGERELSSKWLAAEARADALAERLGEALGSVPEEWDTDDLHRFFERCRDIANPTDKGGSDDDDT